MKSIRYLLLSVIFCGCGGGTFRTLPVEGHVTLDGKPVDKARVAFMPMAGQSAPAGGVTDYQGKFQLNTIEGPLAHRGALPGRYHVIITKPSAAAIAIEEAALTGETVASLPPLEWLIPEKYSQAETSGLSATVEPGMKPLVFELQSH